MAAVLLISSIDKKNFNKAMVEMILEQNENNLVKLIEEENNDLVLAPHNEYGGFSNIIFVTDDPGIIRSDDDIPNVDIAGAFPIDDLVERDECTEWVATIGAFDDTNPQIFDPLIGRLGGFRGHWFKDPKGWWYRNDTGLLEYLCGFLEHGGNYNPDFEKQVSGIRLGLFDVSATGIEHDRKTEKYYFDPETGYVVTGWVELGEGDWFYFNPKSVSGLIKVDNTWHYLDTNGRARELIIIDGELTMLDEKGTLPDGEYTLLEDGTVHKVS